MNDAIQGRQLETLLQVAQLLTSLDVDKLLQSIVQLTVEAVNATNGSFFLFDEERSTLKRFISARDLSDEARAKVSMKILQSGVAAWVIANLRSALIEDTATDPRWLRLEDELRVRSALVVPMFVDGVLRGVMTLEHNQPNHFDSFALRLAEATTNQAGASLRNAELFERVQAQQRQLEGVLRSISDALIVIDADLVVRRANPAAREILSDDGLADGTLEGRKLSDLSNSIAQHVNKMLPSSDDEDLTLMFDLRVEQIFKDFAVTIRRVALDGGMTSGFVIAFHDITTLKDLGRLKTHMMRMASHDLKNPLGVLIGYLDLLTFDITQGIVPDISYVDNMSRVITKMETLIATLLDAHRSERDGGMKRAPIDPNELVSSVIEDAAESAKQHRHTIYENISPTLRPLRGDFVLLKQAMQNLVSNAIKYTPDGGQITIGARAEDSRFYFTVQDNGYGIPTDQQAELFQPYFRGNQPETEHIEGTGVGLSLVKEIAERHGGQVWFNSTYGQGSTFFMWLPLLE